jgi:hypothetical protein
MRETLGRPRRAERKTNVRDSGSERPPRRDVPRGRYQLRHPMAADLPAIQQLVDDCEAAETNERRPSPVRAAASFALPTSEPERNWWVLTQGDAVAGFARICRSRLGS